MNEADLVRLYSRNARPLMLRWMPPNSCIGATRLTVLFFEAHGIPAMAEPVKMFVEYEAKKMAYNSGFTEAELGTKFSGNAWGGEGWPGHLIARVRDRWLIDPSFDQALGAMGLPASTLMPVLEGHPLPPPGETAATAELLMKTGETLETLKVRYQPLEDDSYLSLDAWNDEGLPFLADYISSSLLRFRSVNNTSTLNC